jgi:glucose-1-phosphate adenylyltransferase
MVDSSSQLMRKSMAFVLAGGRGSRLKELTDRRAKPAVYFGGKTRIVDFALSNALNSGIRKMAIATQYKAHSLIRHCQRGWSFLPRRAQRIPRHPARQPADERDAMVSRNRRRGGAEHRHHRQLRRGIRPDPCGRSHLQDGLRTHDPPPRHQRRGRDRGVPDGAPDGGHGVRRDGCGRHDRITSFLEKPADPPGTPADPTIALASMGIYVFSWNFLRDLCCATWKTRTPAMISAPT